MAAKKLVLISDRELDHSFFNELAPKFGFVLERVQDGPSLLGAVSGQPVPPVVVWDVDGASEHSQSSQIREMVSVASKHIRPDRVYLLSNQPVATYGSIKGFCPAFQHTIVRRYAPPAVEILGRVLSAGFQANPMGLEKYFPAGAKKQTITLTKSQQRGPAAEAVKQVLMKINVKSRLATNIAQAIDELLMNAIFNAPHDSQGMAFRRRMNRSSEFELGKTGVVTLEIVAFQGASGGYIGICVADQFGMLKKETVLTVLSQDYQTDEYKPKAFQVGGGLGIHGILDLGMSLLFLCSPRTRLEAMLFLPLTKNHSEFRDGFRFVSYLGGEK